MDLPSRINGLDLFSGIGGISVALRPWVRTVAYCEIERYAQALLLSRMRSGELEVAPIWDDVRTITREVLPSIDIISGGFPCQDISCAGVGVGLEGKRSGLFFEIIRLCSDIRPRFVFLENVPAITLRGLDRVCLELTALGYDCRWTHLSAAAVGACHKRDRWWMLAHASGERLGKTRRFRHSKPTQWSSSQSETDNQRQTIIETSIADSDGKRLEGLRWSEQALARPVVYNGWKSEPTIRRGNNGLPNRVDRIRGLGNAVVPLQAREAFKKLMGINSRGKLCEETLVGDQAETAG